MLEYISAPEAAKKWSISERRVQKLCEENRIPGVAKFSRMWLIPKDAEKPTDKRKKSNFYNFILVQHRYDMLYAGGGRNGKNYDC